MPVIIGQVDTDISVEGGSTRTRSGSGEAADAPQEIVVEELRAAIRELIAEEVERELRRRLPQR